MVTNPGHGQVPQDRRLHSRPAVGAIALAIQARYRKVVGLGTRLRDATPLLAHAVVSPMAACGIKADGPDAVQAPGRIAWSGDHRRDSSPRPAPRAGAQGRRKKGAQNGGWSLKSPPLSGCRSRPWERSPLPRWELRSTLAVAHLREAPTSSASISVTDRWWPSGVSQLRWCSRPVTITRSPFAR